MSKRFAEQELYAHIPNTGDGDTKHEDPFAHCDPRQAYKAGLSFHRVGDRRESNGSYKGIDLTVGWRT